MLKVDKINAAQKDVFIFKASISDVRTWRKRPAVRLVIFV
jgi:hypothetical protein